MAEGEFVCAQPEYLPVMSGIRIWIVFGIAHNGAAHMRKLNADLMMPPGIQRHLQNGMR